MSGRIFPRKLKNDRKREFCIGDIEIPHWEFIKGVLTTFGKYLEIHTEQDLKTTDRPYSYREVMKVGVPYAMW